LLAHGEAFVASFQKKSVMSLVKISADSFSKEGSNNEPCYQHHRNLMRPSAIERSKRRPKCRAQSFCRVLKKTTWKFINIMKDQLSPHTAISIYRKRPLAAAMCISTSLAVAVPLVAQAQQQQQQQQGATAGATIHEFNIPAQALSEALIVFGQQSGLQVSASSELVSGKQAAAVSGAMTAEQALSQLLTGSGLSFRVNGGMVSLEAGGGAIVLPPVQVSADAADGPVEGFRAERSSSATNVDAPLIETPATVNVVTKDFLDTIGARGLEDVIAYIPGVASQNLVSTATAFNIRGFQSEAFDASFSAGGNSIRVNGFRNPGTRYVNDPVLYERIDILKGSSSMLYGTAAPGGIIQFVTKKPEFEQRTLIEGTIGSFDTTRLTLDTTGSFVEGGDLAYRLITSGLNSNMTIHGDNDDISFDDRVIINPQLAWRTPGGGELHASYEYYQRDFVSDPGIKRLADGSFTFNTQPFLTSNSSMKLENHSVMLDFAQPLGENWQISFAGIKGQTDIDSFWDYASGDPDADNRVGRFTSTVDEDYTSNEFRVEIKGDFNTGDQIRHQLTVGVSYLDAENEYDQEGIFLEGDINALNPVFGPAPIPGPPDGFEGSFPTSINEKAIYIQDFISIGEKLTIFGGLRYTDAETTAGFGIEGFFPKSSDEALDYTIGGIYNANRWLNPFISYSTALSPQSGLLLGGEALPFSEAEQIEVGVKSEWFDGQLTTTASVFQIEQTNIAESAPPPDDSFSILVGDQRTRGFEFEAVGNITDQFSMIGGYSYLDAEFTESTTGNEGNTPHSVPKNKVSLFGQYSFSGELDGWRTGLGLIYVDERQGNNENSYKLPDYERIDAFIGYQTAGFDYRLSIENVFNEDYISNSDGSGTINQGAPRFFTMTIGYEF
jgi:iron complex outermembrane receptor protein